VSASAFRRRAIYAGDIAALGGTVTVVRMRSHAEPGEPKFRVDYVSGGMDLVWLSPPISNEDAAFAGARLLAAFTNSKIVE
jgi:hypothetical protein